MDETARKQLGTKDDAVVQELLESMDLDHDDPVQIFECRRIDPRHHRLDVDVENAIPYSKDIICRIGDTVHHPKFGYGIVHACGPGQVSIQFEVSASRKFVASPKNKQSL